MKLDHELGEDEEKLDHGRGRGAGIPTKIRFRFWIMILGGDRPGVDSQII